MNSGKSIKTEIVVVGAGPGGYVAAIRLAQLGKKVVLIEEDKLGGVCLNYGCIPSKAMISALGVFDKIKKSSEMGINADKVALDFTKMQGWKNNIVSKLNKGVEFLCKKNGVEIVEGTAFFEDSNKLKITCDKIVSYIEFDQAVIAVGSKPIEMPGFKFNGNDIISSREVLYLEKVPRQMVIIGGGYIGLELGIVYAKLGSKVSVIEMADQVLPGFDKNISSLLYKSLEKLNVLVYLNAKADKIEKGKIIANSKEKGNISLDFDKALVAVGRKPNTENLGLENTNVKTDAQGFVIVDKSLKTGDKNIYAIGDVSAGPMLAHKASMQGKLVAEIISGKKYTYENAVVPAVVFTDPEIAIVGLSEEEAKSKGIRVKTGKFPFSVSSRAMTRDETEGFTKIIADEKDGRILGAQIVGGEASDLISEAALAIKMKATLEDLALTIHPHPTLSESLMEAAEATMGKAIHILNPK